MDTMTFTKAAAGFLGAFLIFLLGKWMADGLFHVGGHGDEPAYVIDTGESEATEEVAEVSFDTLLASADVEKGSSVFRKCSACHKLEDGANGTGPYLYGVVGRPIASAAGFGYSDALAGLGGDWTPERLSKFLAKPSDFASGTTMSFAGLNKAEDRADVIAYLNTISDAPMVFEAAAESTESEEAAPEEAAAEDAASEEGGDAAQAVEEGAAAEEANADAAASTDAAGTEETPAEAVTEEAPAEPESEEAPAGESSAPSEEAATATAAVSGDVEAGEKVFKKCAACHKLEDGQNGVGPHLYNVVGRPVAGVDGFSYSDVLAGMGGNWTVERLAEFLTKPRDFAPGTKMSFAGLRKEEERQDLIAYLSTIGN
jgi:cytochrome c